MILDQISVHLELSQSSWRAKGNKEHAYPLEDFIFRIWMQTFIFSFTHVLKSGDRNCYLTLPSRPKVASLDK